MKAIVQEITDLLLQGHKERYGAEAVSQLEHALQCATLAEQTDYSLEMITACLLHDIGHSVGEIDEVSALKQGLDFRHEERGGNYLQADFGPAVVEPIRLHVAAKRYLCYADPDYWDGLSPISKRSLELQGGVFSAEEAAVFIDQPYARDAVQLRIWDDQAKISGLSTPDLAHFTDIMLACIKR